MAYKMPESIKIQVGIAVAIVLLIIWWVLGGLGELLFGESASTTKGTPDCVTVPIDSYMCAFQLQDRSKGYVVNVPKDMHLNIVNPSRTDYVVKKLKDGKELGDIVYVDGDNPRFHSVPGELDQVVVSLVKDAKRRPFTFFVHRERYEGEAVGF